MPYGITEDAWKALDRLAKNPKLGVRVRGKGNGPMVFTFKVDRPPLVLTVVVSFQFAPDEEEIIITRVALRDFTEEEDSQLEEDSKENLEPYDDELDDDDDDDDD